MKIVCISNRIYIADPEGASDPNLTVGKVYDLIEYHVHVYRAKNIFRFIDDSGNERSYDVLKEFFISIQEQRDIKLNQLW
jgi:hypothetical protein